MSSLGVETSCSYFCIDFYRSKYYDLFESTEILKFALNEGLYTDFKETGDSNYILRQIMSSFVPI